MPSKVKVTTEDGKSVILTLDDGVQVSTSTATAIDPNEPSSYAAGAWKGLKEGVAGGAKGFVQGLAESPGALVSGIGTMLTQSPVKTVTDTAAAIGRIPAAIRGAGADPEGWGRDIGSLTGQTMLTAALPKAPAMTRGAVRGAVRAGATAMDVLEKHPVTAAAVGGVAGYALGGPMGAIEGALGGTAARGLRILRTVQKLQKPAAEAAPTNIGGRLTGRKAPTSNVVLPKAQLETILEELQTPEPAAPTVPGAAPGGAQAATSSMRLLADQPALKTRFGRTMSQDEASPIYRATDFTKPTRVKVPASKVVATQEGFQNPIIEQYRVHPGSELPSASKVGDEYILNDGHHRALAQLANGATEIELNAHPVDATLATHPQPRAMWLEQMHTKSLAPAEGAPGRLAPVPLSEALTAVRHAATEAKLKLTATEFEEARRLAQRGRPDRDIIDAIKVQRELKALPSFARLPTDAEMQATLATEAASAKARSTNPRYGASQGNYGREAEEGNPFR